MLVLDGIFMQRPELAPYHNLTVFLDGSTRVALRRLGIVQQNLPPDGESALHHVLEWVGRMDRYVAGMRLYLDLVAPADTADIVVDNNDLKRPLVIQ